MSEIEVEGKKINISNPDKLLYKDIGIRKIDYIVDMIELAPYLLPHTSDRALTAIRYPNGVDKPFFYQKRPPANTPEWVDIITIGQDTFINLNSLPTLVWLANLAVIEFHTTFCKYNEDALYALVFDLDPSDKQNFEQAAQCALLVHETLHGLGIECSAKTSGASGLQIYIPTKKYTFEQGRRINTFFANYFTEKYPKLMTAERHIKKRGSKLYFDYLQMHQGKNIICVYSPRAVSCGAVSMPVSWKELESGITPCDFNLKTAIKRLEKKGDMFECMLTPGKNVEALEKILK